MIDLFKQFFSFDKLMKDRLVASFFYLGLVLVIMTFFGTILSAFSMMGHNFFGGLVMFAGAFFSIVFLFVALRLACELMVALFHISDNLSPDGGKSDTAVLDVFEAAREVATKAANSASEVTKSVAEKTKTKWNERNDDNGDDLDNDYADYEDTTPTKPKPAPKKPVAKKTAPKKTVTRKAPAKNAAAKKAPVKKTSVKKPATKKSPAKKPTTKKKAPAKKPTPKK